MKKICETFKPLWFILIAAITLWLLVIISGKLIPIDILNTLFLTNFSNIDRILFALLFGMVLYLICKPLPHISSARSKFALFKLKGHIIWPIWVILLATSLLLSSDICKRCCTTGTFFIAGMGAFTILGFLYTLKRVEERAYDKRR